VKNFLAITPLAVGTPMQLMGDEVSWFAPASPDREVGCIDERQERHIYGVRVTQTLRTLPLQFPEFPRRRLQG
jgi:hypothetical protein